MTRAVIHKIDLDRFAIADLGDGVAIYDRYLRRSHCARAGAAAALLMLRDGALTMEELVARLGDLGMVDESTPNACDEILGALSAVGVVETSD